eukprot:g57175.t1
MLFFPEFHTLLFSFKEGCSLQGLHNTLMGDVDPQLGAPSVDAIKAAGRQPLLRVPKGQIWEDLVDPAQAQSKFGGKVLGALSKHSPALALELCGKDSKWIHAGIVLEIRETVMGITKARSLGVLTESHLFWVSAEEPAKYTGHVALAESKLRDFANTTNQFAIGTRDKGYFIFMVNTRLEKEGWVSQLHKALAIALKNEPPRNSSRFMSERERARQAELAHWHSARHSISVSLEKSDGLPLAEEDVETQLKHRRHLRRAQSRLHMGTNFKQADPERVANMWENFKAAFVSIGPPLVSQVRSRILSQQATPEPDPKKHFFSTKETVAEAEDGDTSSYSSPVRATSEPTSGDSVKAGVRRSGSDIKIHPEAAGATSSITSPNASIFPKLMARFTKSSGKAHSADKQAEAKSSFKAKRSNSASNLNGALSKQPLSFLRSSHPRSSSPLTQAPYLIPSNDSTWASFNSPAAPSSASNSSPSQTLSASAPNAAFNPALQPGLLLTPVKAPQELSASSPASSIEPEVASLLPPNTAATRAAGGTAAYSSPLTAPSRHTELPSPASPSSHSMAAHPLSPLQRLDSGEIHLPPRKRESGHLVTSKSAVSSSSSSSSYSSSSSTALATSASAATLTSSTTTAAAAQHSISFPAVEQNQDLDEYPALEQSATPYKVQAADKSGRLAKQTGQADTRSVDTPAKETDNTTTTTTTTTTSTTTTTETTATTSQTESTTAESATTITQTESTSTEAATTTQTTAESSTTTRAEPTTETAAATPKAAETADTTSSSSSSPTTTTTTAGQETADASAERTEAEKTAQTTTAETTAQPSNTSKSETATAASPNRHRSPSGLQTVPESGPAETAANVPGPVSNNQTEQSNKAAAAAAVKVEEEEDVPWWEVQEDDAGDDVQVSLGDKAALVGPDKDLTVLGVLGRGACGLVQLVQTQDHELLALKSLNRKHLVAIQQVDAVLREKQILTLCKGGPLFAQLKWAKKDQDTLYLALEPVMGGELTVFLDRRTWLSEEATRFIAANLALGLSWLHDKGVVYRDLKPENILLAPSGYPVITDFGFAKDLKGQRTWTNCGTPDYMAPEIVSAKEPYDLNVDWWALGILMFELLVGEPPFFDENPYLTMSKITESAPTFPDALSKEVVDLISKLLHKDAKKRLGSRSFEDIKNHPFFKDIDWAALVAQKVEAPKAVVPALKDQQDMSNFLGEDEFGEPETAGRWNPQDKDPFESF